MPINFYLNCCDSKKLIIWKKHIEIDFTKISSDIIEIIFYCNYKFPINNLPSHIESLILHDNYNFELENLPYNLKQLILGNHYDKALYNLPESLEIIKIGYEYSHTLNYLPKKIQKIICKSHKITSLNIDLPNLTYLDLKSAEILHLTCNNFLNLENTLNALYLPLNHCEIGEKNTDENFDNYINNNNKIYKMLSNFDNLEILSLDSLSSYVEKYPKNLKILILNDTYDYPLDNLPINLEQLTIGEYYSGNFLNLPQSLIYLNLYENTVCDVLTNKHLLINLPKLKKITIYDEHSQCYELKQFLQNANSFITIDIIRHIY